jgi:YidC/Oxa1 family membrane protein insertase
VSAIGALFHALFGVIAQAIVKLHNVTGPVFGKDSGASWALAIVLLTILVRGLMYPLFVKQIKTQRAMTALQPKIKELQAKHKGDKETLNVEMMKLYKEHNANPLAGCLPVLLQMPIFISLFQVLKQLEPKLVEDGLKFPEKFGVSAATAESLGRAKIFGAPIAAGFKSPHRLLDLLNASPNAVKAVALVLIVAMSATTFLTSKQMMGNNAAAADSSQATQQKVLLYVMPLFLGLFGFQVAIGVLIYWTTTNVFSMVQQSVVMRHLGPADGALPAKKPKPTGSPSTGAAKTAPKPGKTTPATKAAPAAGAAGGGTVTSANGSADAGDGSRAAARRPSSRNTKQRGKGQRRGGRR